MKNNQKDFIVPVLLVIVALLAVGGFYVYKNKTYCLDCFGFEPPITDWKTHIYNKYGFEIKLPSDWQVEVVEHNHGAFLYLNSLENFNSLEEFKRIIESERIESTDAGPQHNLSIRYYDDIRNSKSVRESGKLSFINLEEYVKLQSDFIDVQKITFAGKTAFRGRLIGLYDPVTIFVKNKENFYSIGLESDNGMDAELSEEILSTFKFIK